MNKEKMEAKELTDIALGQSAAKCMVYDKGYFKKKISNPKSIQIQTVRTIVNTKEPVRTGTKYPVQIVQAALESLVNFYAKLTIRKNRIFSIKKIIEDRIKANGLIINESHIYIKEFIENAISNFTDRIYIVEEEYFSKHKHEYVTNAEKNKLKTSDLEIKYEQLLDHIKN